MKKIMTTAATLAILASVPFAAQATPEQDLKALQKHFQQRFPGVAIDAYKDGVYAIDEDSRITFEAMEEFPPYEEQLARGEKLFNTPFANGKTYGSCFKNGGIGIRQNYPYFDANTKQVKTLEMEINECRTKNGEQPLDWSKGDIAAISGFMASTSAGKKFNIKVQNAEAQEWYERGKQHFYAKRGQLNLACANCHIDSAGMRIRADLLSPAIGQPTHFPAYRQKWGELGTLQRRYGGCNEQVRAKKFKPQSEEYRALEYFHTYLSNGISVNGPAFRK